MLDPTQLFWTRIAAVAVLIVFVGMLFGLMRQRSRRNSSANWMKTTGDILVSKVELPQTHTSDDQPDARAVVRYRYGVGTETYESENVSFGGQVPILRAHADALVAKYPIGAMVDVTYDPRNPKDAVLQPASRNGLVAQSALTLVFGAIGLVLAVHAIAGKVPYTANGVPLFAYALPAIAFIAACAGFISFADNRRNALIRARWPTTSGKIVTSAIIEETIENKNDDDKRIERLTKRYRADLRYAYRVGQRDYIGTNALGEWTPIYGVRDQAEKAIADYPAGRSVTVHYDPAQPGAAVLEPGNPQGSFAPLVLGALFAIAGVVLLAFFGAVGFGH